MPVLEQSYSYIFISIAAPPPGATRSFWALSDICFYPEAEGEWLICVSMLLNAWLTNWLSEIITTSSKYARIPRKLLKANLVAKISMFSWIWLFLIQKFEFMNFGNPKDKDPLDLGGWLLLDWDRDDPRLYDGSSELMLLQLLLVNLIYWVLICMI